MKVCNSYTKSLPRRLGDTTGLLFVDFGDSFEVTGVVFEVTCSIHFFVSLLRPGAANAAAHATALDSQPKHRKGVKGEPIESKPNRVHLDLMSGSGEL